VKQQTTVRAATHIIAVPETRQPLLLSWLLLCMVALAGLISGLTVGGIRPVRHDLSSPPVSQLALDFVFRLISASQPESDLLPVLVPDSADVRPFIAPTVAGSVTRMSEPVPTDPSAEQQMLVPGWSQPRNLSNSPARVTNPVLLAGAGDQLHALWEENNRIYHSFRRNGVWSNPSSMVTGFQPAASMTADGSVHLVFSSQYFGRYRVFHVIWNGSYWSLPKLVSKTSGIATSPTVAVDKAGLVHASWADTAPGFSIIYHGWFDSTWLNEPIQNARGDIPVLVADAKQDKLYLAYQAASLSGAKREIYFAQGHVYDWPAPENVSLTPDTESMNAALAIDGESKLHLVWQEVIGNKSRVRYRFGRQSNWSPAQDISDPAQDAHYGTVAVTQSSQVSVVWQQGPSLIYRKRFTGADAWDPEQVLVSNSNGLGDPVLAGSQNGEINLGWTGWLNTSERDLFLSQREPLLRPKMFIPSVVTGR